LLPKDLGEYKEEEVQVSNVMVLTFVMELLCVFAKRRKPLDVDFEKESKELIEAIADAPVAFYKGGVQKSVGRFGPFIKWNSLFINVSKKYDFDNLSQADIETLIEDKLQKNIDKVYTTGKRKGFWLKKLRRLL
jgi:DNA topoisomerase-1